ncbi:MAG: FIST N-terminal domain-containing protein [Verrucomicrobiota bacterium]
MRETLKNAGSSCLITSSFDASLTSEAAAGCLDRLGVSPDLVILFVSSDYRPYLRQLTESVQIDGHANRIVGASAEGLYGVNLEHENASGVSMLFLKTPNTAISIESRSPGKPSSSPLDNKSVHASHLLFGNPLRTNLQSELKRINTDFPDSPTVGGLIRGGPHEEDLFLFNQDGILDEDALVIGFHGEVAMQPLVSQGCRPIGNPFVVTGALENEIFTIGRRDALSVLEETFASLNGVDRMSALGNIFAGLAITEAVEEFETGNFLIRSIVDADLEEGRIVLDSPVRVGQTLQFQLRDSDSASASLKRTCERAKTKVGGAFASLLFGGHRRGRFLFDCANHDAEIFYNTFGELPLSGCFTHGEIGPVAGRNFRHDQSLCAAVFCHPDLD